MMPQFLMTWWSLWIHRLTIQNKRIFFILILQTKRIACMLVQIDLRSTLLVEGTLWLNILSNMVTLRKNIEPNIFHQLPLCTTFDTLPHLICHQHHYQLSYCIYLWFPLLPCLRRLNAWSFLYLMIPESYDPFLTFLMKCTGWRRVVAITHVFLRPIQSYRRS